MIQENDSELQVVEIRHFFFFFLKLLNSDETVFRLLDDFERFFKKVGRLISATSNYMKGNESK